MYTHIYILQLNTRKMRTHKKKKEEGIHAYYLLRLEADAQDLL